MKQSNAALYLFFRIFHYSLVYTTLKILILNSYWLNRYVTCLRCYFLMINHVSMTELNLHCTKCVLKNLRIEHRIYLNGMILILFQI